MFKKKLFLLFCLPFILGLFMLSGCGIVTPVAVTGVTLDQATMALTAGGATGTLVATVAPADATDKSVTWSSSASAVATVVNGVVTPLTAGTTTITVTTVDGDLTATCEVTVNPAPVAVTGVTLDQVTMTLTAGGATGTLVATVAPATATNQSVTWSSSAPAVATVANGVVTPLTAGTTTIIVATVDGDLTATCAVTVNPALVMVSLESPLYIIGGENHVEGFMDFLEEMHLIYQSTSAVSGYPLVEGIERHLEDIRKCNSILIIPPILEGIQEFRDLDDKYPDLCPLSCDELESELGSHSSPLLYFSQDIGAEKLRGVIVASQIDPSLAELLSEGVPLDISFRYEDGQLQILE